MYNLHVDHDRLVLIIKTKIPGRAREKFENRDLLLWLYTPTTAWETAKALRMQFSVHQMLVRSITCTSCGNYFEKDVTPVRTESML